MRYTNLFPFRGAGRLDGKPHLSLNPAGDGIVHESKMFSE
jgi:hypothetical protein